MPTEKEMKEARKAIAYDLINIIDEKPEQETYTAEEIKKIIKIYVSTAHQDKTHVMIIQKNKIADRIFQVCSLFI